MPPRPAAIRAEVLEQRSLLSAVWVAQGPTTSQNGQVEGILDREVIGAVHAVVTHPTDANTMYVGSVNGGVWKTTNATATDPTWTPIFDQQSSLSIGSMTMDPSDPDRILLGFGHYSSFFSTGGDLVGVALTTDGGDTWAEIDDPIFRGKTISGVALRGDMLLVSASPFFGDGSPGGLFRRANASSPFVEITGTAEMPAGGIFDLVGDPGNPNRIYVSGTAGIFRTDDAGLTWDDVSGAAAVVINGTTNNLELAVHNHTGNGTNAVYAVVVNNGVTAGIFRSDDGVDGVNNDSDGETDEPDETNFVAMDVPATLENAVNITAVSNTSPIVITSAGHGLNTGNLVQISGVTGTNAANGTYTITVIPSGTAGVASSQFSLNGTTGDGDYVAGGVWQLISNLQPRTKPGGQGAKNLSVAADPFNAFLVYVGGDRQDRLPNNSVGADDFTARLFRGDASITPLGTPVTVGVPNAQWAPVTHNGTFSNSAPHADSRDMVFDLNGNLIELDDGGIYRRTSPQDSSGDWYSIIGNGLQVTEMHNFAYDNNSNILISGNQDTGTTYQFTTGGLLWNSLSTADGGDVAVDNLTRAGSGQSIRYSSVQNLGRFQRTVWDASNVQVNVDGVSGTPTLTLMGGGNPFAAQFVTPVVLNEIDPTRLILGGSNSVYESPDRGNSVTEIGVGIVAGAIAYGGRSGGVNNPDVLYVGRAGTVFVRTTSGGALTAAAALPAGIGTITDIELDPNDWNRAWVLDNNQVFQTTDAGASWTDITGNLAIASLQTIEYMVGPVADGLLVGGLKGVYKSISTNFSDWSRFGIGLPNTFAWDMDYDSTDDVLALGTLGRGAWTVSAASQSLVEPDRFEVPPTESVPLGHNNSREAASPIGVGGGIHLTDLNIHLPTDQDWYRFEVLRQDGLDISTVFSQTDGNLNFDVVDANGNVLGSSSSYSTDRKTVSLTDLLPGSYFVHVSAADSSTTDYQLEITPHVDANPDFSSPTRVFYVNDASTSDGYYALAPGNNDNDGLSAMAPKATVQDVLDDYDIGPNDLFVIDTGMYTAGMNLTATDEGAAYAGAPGGSVFDNGAGFDLVDADGNVFYGLTFSGFGTAFNIRGDAGVSDSNDNLIRDNSFDGRSVGIGQTNGGVTVTGNTFVNTHVGVSLNSVTSATVSQNTFSETVETSVSNGIAVNSSSNVSLQGNSVSGADTGLALHNSMVSVTGNNIFQDNVGVGITFGTVSLAGNHIHHNTTGVGTSSAATTIGGSDWSAESLNEIDHNAVGIHATHETTIHFNRLHHNATAILANGGSVADPIVIDHNVLFRNTTAAVNADNVNGTVITSNTIYAPSGDGVRVQGFSQNVSLRNNIVWVENGYGINVATNSQPGFDSDYNNLFATRDATHDGKIVSFQKDFIDLFDWQVESNYDSHSIGYTVIDPTLDNPQFVNLAADDYRLTDETSTSLDAGDPGITVDFSGEPDPDGGRLNLGAYGNTPLAGLSRASFLDVDFPNFFTDLVPEIGHPILFHTFNVSGNVDIDLLDDAGEFLQDIAIVAAADGATTWTPSLALASVANRYRIRVRSIDTPSIEDISREAFSVPPVGTEFFVDNGSNVGDQYTMSATGSNRNTGKTANDPKANLIALLRSYDLNGGDTVFIDAGTYVHVRNIVLSAELTIGNDEGLTLTGPTNQESSPAVLDRANPFPGSTNMDLNDADFVTVSHLTLTGAQNGLLVRNGSTNFHGDHLIVSNNAQSGIRIENDSEGTVVDALSAFGNGGDGISILTPISQLLNSSAHDNGGTGITIAAGPADGTLFVSNIDVFNNNGNGLNVSASGAIDLTELDVHDNGGTGLSISANRFELTNSQFVSNGFGVSASASTFSVIGAVNDEGQPSLAANAPGATSGERGNVFTGNTNGGISASGNVLVFGNSVSGAPGSTGAGISLFSATAEQNVVHGYAVGIAAQNTFHNDVIRRNRVFDNSAIGITAGEDDEVSDNVVYSNGTGIRASGSPTIQNNVIYDNDVNGIFLSSAGGNADNRPLVLNNTVFAPVGNAVRVEGGSNFVELRNNILSVQTGFDISVANDSQVGFKSDYNVLQTSGTGKVALWQGLARPTIGEWRLTAFTDQHSLASDPLFAGAGTSNAVLGFVNAANDGTDDDFHLKSTEGRFTGGFVPTVQGSANGLPQAATVTETTDAVQSPAIDRGADGDVFNAEPTPNGGFINIGAYGNTTQASKSPAQYIIITVPDGGEIWPAEQTFDIEWCSQVTGVFGGDTLYRDEVLTDTPQGYWRLNEVAGTTAQDLSGAGTDGTYEGTVVLSEPSVFSTITATGFNSSDDVVTVADYAGLNGETLSVEAWIFPTAQFASFDTVVMKTTNSSWTDGYGMYLSSNATTGQLHFFINSYSSNQATANVPLNEWSHVVGTYDGSAIRLYVNGELIGSTDYSEPITHSTNALRIGNGEGGYPWHGSLGDVAVYNTAISAARVAEHYSRNPSSAGDVDIELIQDGTSNTVLIADDTPNDGNFVWTVPNSITPATNYRVRLTHSSIGGLTDASNNTLEITEPIHEYYVNIPDDQSLADNQYTTASGSNGNTGFFPSNPKASIEAVLDAYDLAPGDVIYVDTGSYLLTVNIKIEQEDSGIIIQGPTLAGRRAVLDRDNQNGGSYVVELVNADSITLNHLALTGGFHGLFAGSGSDSDNAVISHLEVFGNSSNGIHVETSNDAIQVNGSTIFDNGSVGVALGGNGNVSNNIFYGNPSAAISASTIQSSDVLTISGNRVLFGQSTGIVISSFGTVRSTVSGNIVSDSGTGISAGGSVLVSGNTVFENSTGIAISTGEARGNTVYRNINGIVSGSIFTNDTIVGNRVFDNAQSGISIDAGDTADGNQVYYNQVGIRGFALSGPIRNNLIYQNTESSILLTGGQPTVTNNTIYELTADGITVDSSGTSLRNNLISVGAGYGVTVSDNAQTGFNSDFNLFQFPVGTEEGGLGLWQDHDFDLLSDWFFQLGFDQNSLTGNPNFSQIAGVDGQLGFSNNDVGVPIILDDGVTTGTWATVSGVGRDGDTRESAIVGDFTTFTFTGLTAGATYDIAATWTHDPERELSEYSDRVGYEVRDGETTIALSWLNQRTTPTVTHFGGRAFTADGTDWLYLETVTATGTSLTVRVLNLEGDRAIADAVRLQQIVGDHGADDKAGFRLAASSQAIDEGDPLAIYASEPSPNGNRINIGSDGNTSLATTSDNPLIQLLTPNGFEKLTVGKTVEVAWQSAGLKTLDPVLLVNAGGPAFDRYVPGAQFLTAGSPTSTTNAISLTGVTDPAPQEVYQSFDTAFGENSHITYALPVPNGEYTLRVHFANPVGYSISELGQAIFDLRAEGNLLADDLDLFAVAGGENHIGVSSYTVNVTGGDGLSLDFVNQTSSHLIVAGLELFRTNATGTADPRASLELSLDNGTTWAAISEATNLPFDRFGGGSFNWTVPAGSETAGLTALVRVTSGAVDDVSNHSFLIAPTGDNFYVNDGSTVGDVTFGAAGSSAVGNDLNSGKSLDQPVASLIGLLNSYDFGPGDVIHVNTGNYELLRNLVIGSEDAGVTITGPETAVARLSRGTSTGDDSVIEIFGADGVTISHLTLTDANFGVNATNSDGLEVASLHVFGFNNTGIHVSGGADAVISHNVVESNATGISTSSLDAEVTDNQVYGNSTGISFSGQGLIEENQVFSNSTGISASHNGQQPLNVIHNIVSFNAVGISAVSGVTVSSNNVFGNSSVGISAIFGGALITDNDVWNNNSGIATSTFANDVIRGNRVYHNATVGISANANDVVDGNQIYGNATGVEISSTAQVTHNLIYDNADHGVLVNSGTTGALIGNNTIVQPVGDAVRLQNTSQGVLVENNILTAADGFAISVDSNSQQDFASDYNVLQFPVGTVGGGLGEWQTRDFDALTSWQFELGLDHHSRNTDPNFTDANGADNVAGYSTASVGAVQIIDNGGTGFSTIGTWDADTSGLNGGELISTATSESASWLFTGLEVGATYELAVTWLTGGTASAGVATYFVFDGSELISRPQIDHTHLSSGFAPNDFSADGADWERLGTFVLDSTSLKLTLKPPATGDVYADAVRLQRIEGNGGVDDVIGYRLQSNSPAIDNGNPLTPFTLEPQTNGNRVNVGHQGGTVTATLSPSSQVQLISPNGNEKLEAGSTVPIQWQIAGIGATDPVAVLNVGGAQAGFFAPDQFQTAGSTFASTTSETINLSGADLPAPAQVYQSWKSAEFGEGKHLTYHFPIADGTYTVRLHFTEPNSFTTVGSREFDIVLNGATAADDFDILAAAGGVRRAVTRTFTVAAAGGEGVTVDLVNETAEAILSGLEVLRQNASGQADPRATLELSTNGGVTWTVIEDNLPHDRFGHGEYLWTVPANVAAAGDAAQVRVSVNPTDVSDGSFLIVNGGHDFYVNDGSTTGDVFTTAVGNDLNSGKTTATPMANLAALLDAYDLGPGDVIHVDTGNYLVLRNIVIGEDDAGVRIEGPEGESVQAILDRDLEGQTFSHVFEIVGADDVTIDSLGITGAYQGILVTGGSDRLTLSDSKVFGNANIGVRVDQGGHGHVIEANQILNNGAHGLFVLTDALVKDNQVSGQGTGIFGGSSSETLLEIRNNTVTGNSSVGIEGHSHVLVSGNTVTGQTTGTGINIYFGAEASHNVVFGNQNGIVSTTIFFSEEHIFGNRVFFNSAAGIVASYLDHVDSNSVYSNSTGISLSSFGGLVVNNLVYANTNFGITVNGNIGDGPRLINNSVFQDVGDALRFNGAANAEVFNNIVWINAGHALFVDSSSQTGFTSNRNVITRGPNPIAPGENAFAGFFNGSTVTTLADFQVASDQDLLSVEADVKWIDINGADNVLGYSTAGVGYDGGTDDNFGLFRFSPAIDRADGDAAPDTDYLGAARHDDPGTPNTGVGDPLFVDIGAFEFLGDSNDLAPPTVLSSSPVTLHASGGVSQARRTFSFTFSEPLNAVDARAATNFTIRSPGVNGMFDEIDDEFFPVTPYYTIGSTTATITIPDFLELGTYRLTISGDSSIRDTSANKLDGDNNGVEGGDYVRTFTVVPNTAPTADNDSATTAEDMDLTLAPADLLTGDNDPDGDPLSIVVVAGPTHGTLTPTDDGGLIYSPDDNYFGSDSFTYRATDGLATSNLATVSLTITAVNDAPVAVNDAYDVNEDDTLHVTALLGLLANDSDIDTASNLLSVTLVDEFSNGDLTLNSDGSFDYTPDLGFSGTVAFTYRVSDGDKTDDATVTITVLAVNDAPIAVNDRYETGVNTGVDGDLVVSAFAGVLNNDTDEDFNPLTVMLVSDVSHGDLDLNEDGSFMYTPEIAFTGSVTFTYKANDGFVDSNIATVTIIVDSFNAEIHGVKFNDLNNDGVRDPGTPATPGDEAEFNWQAVASELDLNQPLFPSIEGLNQFPYTKLNGGAGTLLIIEGFEDILAELTVPADLTFSFGDTTDPFDSDPALTLDEFDNGDISGIAHQFFRHEAGVTDNRFFLFNDGVVVATGVILEVVVETTPSLFSFGHGTVRFTAPGADPTIYNELLELSGNTGIVQFSISSFDFDGTVSGLQDGSLFDAEGSVFNLGDDGTPAIPGESGLGFWTIQAFQDADGDGFFDPDEIGDTTQTSFDDGSYSIEDLPAGTYVVQEVLSDFPNWVQTFPGAEAQFQYVVTLAAGQVVTGKDFGNHFVDPMTSEIRGIKWNDVNANGVRDGVGSTDSIVVSTVDDAGSANPDSVAVFLAANDPLTFQVSVTIPDGAAFVTLQTVGDDHFVFQQSDPSFLENIAAGGTATFTVTLQTFSAGFSDDFEIRFTDFGTDFGTTTVHVTTPELEPVLSDWTIFLDADDDGILDEDGDGVFEAGEENFTKTDANGAYAFTGLSGGIYFVNEVIQAGFEQTFPGVFSGFEHFVILDPASVLTNINFGNRLANFAPTATADEYEINEDGALNGTSVLANDDDPEDDTLTAVLDLDVSRGTLDLNTDGTFSYEPDDNFNGIDSFTYHAHDSLGNNSTPVTVTITVTEVNDAPSGTNDPLSSVAEDSGLRVISIASLLGNDSTGPDNENGQTLMLTGVSGAIGGTVAINGANVEFTPTQHFNGTASFTYTLRDNGTTDGTADFLISMANVSFTVTEVNDAPAGMNDGLASVAEDSGLRVISFASLLGNDTKGPANESGQTLTITEVSNAVGGTVAINGTNVEFTPTADFNGVASFTYMLRDDGTTNGTNDFLTSMANVSFTVTEVNDAPTGMNDDLASIAEDSGLRVISFASLLGNDTKGPANESGQTLTITEVSNVVGGTVTINGTNVEFTPTQHSNGAASFTYTLRDDGTTNAANDFLTSTANVSFTITEVNDAPTGMNDDLASVAEDSGVRTISFASLLGNDFKGPANESGQTLTITEVSNPVGGTVTIDGTDVKFTPADNFNGSASFTYTLRDDGTTNGTNNFLTNTATVSFTVTEVNDAPSGMNGDLASVLEDSGVRVISFASLVGNDSKGPANESGQSLTITLVSNPVGGAVVISGTNVEFTPTLNFIGAASFTYTLRDDGATNGANDFLTSTANVSFMVTAVNDAPSFTKGPDVTTLGDGVQKVFDDWTTTFSAGPSDESAQTLDFIVTNNNAALFTVAPDISPDGTLTYTPKANIAGSATVTVRIQDSGLTANGGADTSAAQTFTINLTGLNKAPSFIIPKPANATHTSLEDAAQQTVANWVTPASINAGAGEVGQHVDFVVTIPAASNSLFSVAPAISPAGVLTYTAAPDANGTVTVTVVAHDDGGTAGGTAAKNTSAAQTFTITITPVNDLPSFTLINTEVNAFEDAAAQTVNGFATSLKGPANESAQTLTFPAALMTNDNTALFSTQPVISANGALTFKPALNAHGTANITVRLKDSGGTTNEGEDTSEEQTFTINVNPVNDAPTFTIPKTGTGTANHSNHTSLEDAGLQTIAAWVTPASITAGPGDLEQTVDFLVTVPAASVALFTDEGQPAISPEGELTYEAAPNANGTVTVTVMAHDDGGTDNGGKNTSVAQTFTITIKPVNDTPSFNLSSTEVNVLEDALPAAGQVVNNLVTNLSKGAANETSQTLTFVVTNNNPTLFSTQPAISAAGVLSYKLAKDKNGEAEVTVSVKDNGAVADGGPLTSDPQTFTINVTAVNDAPTFTKGANQTGKEDDPPKDVAWATLIKSGPADEADQILDFIVTTSNDAFFSELPEVSATTGRLTYATAPNASGTVTVTVRLHDDGGTENGGLDTSILPAQTFTIAATAVNDLPTMSDLEDQTIDEDISTGPLELTIGDVETPAATLKLAATSSNTKLIPVANVVFGGTGADRTVTITPVDNLFGTATITVKLTDGNSGVTQQTFLVTVDPVNDAPPTITNIADVTIDEDKTTAAIAVKIDDVDDKLVNLNVLTVTATSSNTDLVPDDPANIVLGGTLGNRTIMLKPLANQFGETTITVTVTDSSGETAEDTFLLTVRPISDGPIVTVATFTVDEYTTIDTEVGTVEAIDPDPDDTVTTFAITGGNTNNVFKIDNEGVIRVNDPTKIDFETLGVYKLMVTATDNNNLKGAAGTITVNVNDQSFDRTVTLNDVANTLTVLKVGTNLVVRAIANGPNLIPDTRLEDVNTLTIEGGNVTDKVILDASLSIAATVPNRFKGQIFFNGNDGGDELDSSKITVVNTFRANFDGGAGNDSVKGGAETDVLNGGEGNDTLGGGKGDDTYLFGDADAPETDTISELASEGTKDHLDFSAVTGAVVVNLGTTLVNGLTSEQALATHANRTVRTGATGTAKQAPNFENVTGGLGDDSILGNAAANSLVGGEGSDTIRGSTGNDTIDGGEGDDFLFGDTGNDAVSGGNDNDVLVGDLRGAGATAGNDLLKGDAGHDSILGGLGTDTLQGGGDDDLLFGEEANDMLTGGDGADRLSGGAGTTNFTDVEEGIDLIGAFTTELNALLAALP